MYPRRRFFDAIKALYPPHVNNLWQFATLLGDPQAHIGGTGDNGGIGMPVVEIGEAVEACRRGKEALVREQLLPQSQQTVIEETPEVEDVDAE